MVEELRSQLSQRSSSLAERGRALSLQEERLRDAEVELRAATEAKSQLSHRVAALEDDISVLQRAGEMATARRKAAELSLHDADGTLAEQSQRLRETERLGSFERVTNADREAVLKREADRLAASERALRSRAIDLERERDFGAFSPLRSPAGASSAASAGRGGGGRGPY